MAHAILKYLELRDHLGSLILAHVYALLSLSKSEGCVGKREIPRSPAARTQEQGDQSWSEALAPGSQVDFVTPPAASLPVHLPIGLCNRVRCEQGIRSALGRQFPVALRRDLPVDDHMSDV